MHSAYSQTASVKLAKGVSPVTSLREKELQQNQIKILDSNASPIETDSEVLVKEIDDIDEDNTFITFEH
ncbi:2036_t:CDS:2 [Funneliformis mosseae]|uniref:2036_t:CDS:1 n=1 Tax=Funneliformis mosseae TaxID=27381 RepID=A0A9N9FB30_FUNMO|nr:2036_t:CDS:2 [Funneliformis mosseae]